MNAPLAFILPGNKDHIQSQLARVCFFHRERVPQRGLASAPEGEMQVNMLVSNLLISLEGKKKTLTTQPC